MPDVVLQVNTGVSEPHQASISTASSAAVAAGVLRVVVPNGTGNEAIIRGLSTLLRACRVNPRRFKAD